ncbi:MAG: N-acetyl-gamma-glutamyl-phosphate reductase [Phycisphaerae bacterium SM23_33]|nr:MAG: N-acetyl-gamma-glutamyl-phosphate reductase [Phycisphaerae bacterium SM23_33]
MSERAGTIRVALVGGSGYAGFEAIRLLRRHPSVGLVGIYGPPEELGPITEFHPLLSRTVEMDQELYEAGKLAGRVDLALLCVPHKVAMSYVPGLRDAGIRVIDLSADYRLKDAGLYEKWYCPHTDAGRLAEAVYGLPEYFAKQIAEADLVANPGCYPTCAVLPLAPVLKAGLVEPAGIVVSAVSGVSGAGRKSAPAYHFPRRNENFEPYAPGTHRHMPEIEEVLSEITGLEVDALFVPHLCPMDRGILCSIYARPARQVTAEQLTDVLERAYADAPFVRVRADRLPATKDVATTNFCDLAARAEKGRVILFSALDNLIKGASGQAVQNMNIMFGLDQATGLY